MAYCYHCMTKLDSPDMPFCPECGQKHNFHQAQSFELPAGTMLSNERYLVGECMSEDDFILTYIGYDLKMDRKVIIKEIYYKNIFFRNTTHEDDDLNVRYDNRIIFNNIMKQISKECIALSETDSLTNVAKVYDWFSENNTAYIVCEFISDVSLADRADEIGGYEWKNLYSILKPLLESLTALHEKNVYHKNIKPKNIKIRKKLNGAEELVLTEFGFARPNIEEGLNFSQSTPYEPPEQRNRTEDEGEYTDIYSTSATIYYALTAAEPIDKITKNIDEIFPLLKPYRKSKRIPENVYYALKYTLQPDHKTRCQSIETFITRLETVQKPITVKSGSTPKAQTPIQTSAPAPLSSQTIIASPSDTEKKTPQDYVPNMVNDSKPSPTAPPPENNSQYMSYAGNPNMMQQTAAVEKPKDKKKGIIIALTATVCVLLLGIAVLTVLLISNSNKEDNDKPEKNNGSDVTVSEKADDEDNEIDEPNENDPKNENDEQSDTGITEPVNNSALEIDAFKKNAENLNSAIQEAVAAYNLGDTTKIWNGKTAAYATVGDVCTEKSIDRSEEFYEKEIDETEYYMVWTNSKKLTVWGGEDYQPGYAGNSSYIYSDELKEKFNEDFAEKFSDNTYTLQYGDTNEKYTEFLNNYGEDFFAVKVTDATTISELEEQIEVISNQIITEAIGSSANSGSTENSDYEYNTDSTDIEYDNSLSGFAQSNNLSANLYNENSYIE